MLIDLHCHTRYSPDSLTTVEALLYWMDRRGLDMVSITDHNTIAGALDFQSRAPDRFLVGEEIKTSQGELLALFVVEEVPPGLSIQETIDRVRVQGGLVGVSHPLDRVRGEAVGPDVLDDIHIQLDFVEVLNARTTFPSDNQRARELAARWGLPGSAGSDAHAPFEVGRAYVNIAPFDGPAGFLDGLARGQVCGRLSIPLVHFFSMYAKWRRRFGAK
jgi:predicted metal-dependent phosphoesterase TrpH